MANEHQIQVQRDSWSSNGAWRRRRAALGHLRRVAADDPDDPTLLTEVVDTIRAAQIAAQRDLSETRP